MQYRLKKTVVMVGMMGAGKTAVGRALAQLLGVAFLDSDAEIEAAANMTVQEIFARDGETFFREKETQVIARLLGDEACVLSTGGGAFLAERNRDLIREKGVSVWLNAELEVLWQRVKHKDTRPLLKTADPRGTLAEIFDARAPIYALSDVAVESTAAVSVDEMAERVVAALMRRPDVVEEKKHA